MGYKSKEGSKSFYLFFFLGNWWNFFDRGEILNKNLIFVFFEECFHRLCSLVLFSIKTSKYSVSELNDVDF